MTIRVVAHVIAKPDQIDALKALTLSILEPTRQESGCIQYELHQNLQDPTDFTFIEEWESEAALEAHLQTPHLQAAMAQLDGIVAAMPDIRRYQRLG
ncbi:putative quinol monooxygenase [Alkalinema sp. FACHB-956]|uniref:putative quinol monooxygenase n=1 Tax=Alkalinema sp. FACHB-956 TaxID=2692768 RepID=UPI001681C35F|nr:putative quinol monooxygenase [Alkalinema sp. FACHB-956]MBD2325257.1 antibiotic biosynthesis monooxygenase [Alkalinema sp. FACHB-956]